jgi:hypothetical protein
VRKLKFVVLLPLGALGLILGLYVAWLVLFASSAIFAGSSSSLNEKVKTQVPSGNCANLPMLIRNQEGGTGMTRLVDGAGVLWEPSRSDGGAEFATSRSYWLMEEVPGQLCPKATFLARDIYDSPDGNFGSGTWRVKLGKCAYGLQPCTPTMLTIAKRSMSQTNDDGSWIQRTSIEPICTAKQFEAGCPGFPPPK